MADVAHRVRQLPLCEGCRTPITASDRIFADGDPQVAVQQRFATVLCRVKVWVKDSRSRFGALDTPRPYRPLRFQEAKVKGRVLKHLDDALIAEQLSQAPGLFPFRRSGVQPTRVLTRPETRRRQHIAGGTASAAS